MANLMNTLNTSRSSTSHARSDDKLLQTKLAQQRSRQQKRDQLAAEKAAHVEERLARGAAYREIRALNGSSKRAAKDARQVRLSLFKK